MWNSSLGTHALNNVGSKNSNEKSNLKAIPTISMKRIPLNRIFKIAPRTAGKAMLINGTARQRVPILYVRILFDRLSAKNRNLFFRKGTMSPRKNVPIQNAEIPTIRREV